MASKRNLIKMVSTVEEKTIRQLFDEFQFHNRARSLSPYTLANYERNYHRLKEFLGTKGIEELCDINKHIMDEFIISLKEGGELNPVSINSCLRGVKALLNYGMNMNYMDKFPISLPRAEKQIKECYTDDELKALLVKPKKLCEFWEYRNWVMIQFLMATGCRLRTLTNVRIKDLDFDNYQIILNTTKNKKPLMIPMSVVLAKTLREYLQYRKGEVFEYLFVNRENGQLTKDAMTNTISKYNRKKGVKKTGIHLFRHTFARNWILGGGDVFRLQKILGHSSLEVVKEYANLYDRDLQTDFGKFNLLDKFNPHKEFIRMIK